MAKLKKFEDLTPAGKRVRICKDALAQLDAKKLIATPGTYVRASKPAGTLQGALENTTCKVCALGAALCGLTVNNGDLSLMHNWGEYSIYNVQKKLLPYFSWQQMALIEGCFEGNFVAAYEYLCAPFADSVFAPSGDIPFKKYKNLVRSAEKRLRRILENIIVNRGTFKMPEECLVHRGKPVYKNPKFDFKAV